MTNKLSSLANSKGFDFSFEDLQDTLDPGDTDKPLETKDLQLVAGGARALNAVSDGLVCNLQFAPSSRLKAAVERSLVAVSSLKGSSPIKHETERSTQAPKQGKKDFDNNNQLSHYIALQAESLAERLMHAQDFKSPLENSVIAHARLNSLIKTLGNDNNQLQKYIEWSELPCPEDLPLGNHAQKKN